MFILKLEINPHNLIKYNVCVPPVLVRPLINIMHFQPKFYTFESEV